MSAKNKLFSNPKSKEQVHERYESKEKVLLFHTHTHKKKSLQEVRSDVCLMRSNREKEKKNQNKQTNKQTRYICCCSFLKIEEEK